MKNVFSENMKMADLVCHNSKLLSVLSRFEINLGFGDHSVEEVCKMYNVDTQFFLLICNVYCDEDFTPHYEDLKCVDIDSMIKYLHISHNYYLHERLPHIEEHFNRIIEACPSKYAIPLKRFFDEYKNEVATHFEYEETVVFPYLKALENKTSDILGYNIGEFKGTHSSIIEDNLNDLLNILVKYLPADVFPKERIEISMDIIELSADIVSHAMIEDRILIPFVEHLELKNDESR